jgi:hypothetical protein
LTSGKISKQRTRKSGWGRVMAAKSTGGEELRNSKGRNCGVFEIQ